MGLRLQRRFRILPGVRLNLSGSGVGLSVGARGAHIGVTARGQRYASVGVPGTGVSWREYEHTEKTPKTPKAPGCDLCEPNNAHIHAGVVVAFLAGLLLLLVVWGGRF